MGKCPRYNCAQTFETEHDLENHLTFHCANRVGELKNMDMGGQFSRRAHYGFSMPPGEIQLFNNKILVGRTTRKWGCLCFPFQRGRRRWRQVYGHIRASRRYTSRLTNAGWNIPFHEHGKMSDNTRNDEIAKHPLTDTEFAAQTQLIRKTTHNDTARQCTQRNK